MSKLSRFIIEREIKGIIFDFDGTLCNSIQCYFGAICSIFDSQGLQRPNFLDWVANSKRPFANFWIHRGVRLSASEIQSLWQAYVTENAVNCELFNDVFPFLGSISIDVDKRAIISSGVLQRLEGVLRRSDALEMFSPVVMAHDKSVAIAEVCAGWKLKPREVVFIGDMAFEIEDAVKAGVIPVGITRNNGTDEILRAEGAKLIINGLLD